MATDIEQALFTQEQREISDLPEASRWKLERDESVPLGLFATMHSVKDPKEYYKARIRWSDYFQAPSLKFINLESGADNDPRAWPQCYGFRPSSLDACIAWTSEGQRLHPEWQNSQNNRFPNIELPMQFILLQLQVALDTTYTGRGC